MGKKPNLSYLRVFGSEAYVHVEKQFRKKLDAKTKKMLLVGYQTESSNYRLYDPTIKYVLVSQNIIFNETPSYENTLPEDHNNRELRILANKQKTEIHPNEPEANGKSAEAEEKISEEATQQGEERIQSQEATKN